MTIQSAVPVSFDAFLPRGAFVVDEVEPILKWSDDGRAGLTLLGPLGFALDRPQAGPGLRCAVRVGIRHGRYDSLRSLTDRENGAWSKEVKFALTREKQNPRHVETRRGFLGPL